MRSLILGGARSGKSALAERMARDSQREVVYIATAQALDEEMHVRIAHHRAQRPPEWACVEAPQALAAAVQTHAKESNFVLIDCLTLWLSNLLADPDPSCFTRERDTLLAMLPHLPGEVVMVSNEVGLGIVPMGKLSRRFMDEAGRLHQALAAQCDRVVFVAAGLPLTLKGAPP